MKYFYITIILIVFVSDAPQCLNTWESFPSTIEVSKIVFDRNNTWIGYFGGLVQRIHNNMITSYQIPYADRNNYTSTIIIDGSKAWFGLEPYIMSNRTFLTCAQNDSVVVYKNISASNIRDGLMHSDGRIWFIANDKVVCMQDTLFQVSPFPYVATSIAKDTDGLLWVGTGICKLLRYDGREWTEIVSKYNYNPIYAIACDKHNTLWMATYLGPIAYHNNKWEYLNEEYSIDSRMVSVAIDQKNIVWFGTENDGVLRFDGTTWTNLTVEDGMIDNHVWTIAVDDKNVKWFGTDKGISCLTENTVPASVSWGSPMEIDVSVSPNPFNAATTIRYIIPESGPTELSIYSIFGQKVATLVDGQVSAGVHAVRFDGSKYASGVYFYRFESAGLTKTGKMLLLK